VIARDVTAGEIIYAVLRVRFFWPLYALLYLYIGMHLKMRWIEYRTRRTLEPLPPTVRASLEAVSFRDSPSPYAYVRSLACF
jgi:hypothetical protein